MVNYQVIDRAGNILSTHSDSNTAVIAADKARNATGGQHFVDIISLCEVCGRGKAVSKNRIGLMVCEWDIDGPTAEDMDNATRNNQPGPVGWTSVTT